MPKIKIEAVQDGDVLAADVLIDEEFLFGVGTVLSKKRIEILKQLGLASVVIENRNRYSYSKKETFENIDKRFSYVKNIPIMEQIKRWMKDIISNK